MTNLFSQVGDITLSPPTSQKELVLWHLIHENEIKGELTIGSYFQATKSSKISSRIGEIERSLNKVIVERVPTEFVNRFGHSSQYVVYKRVLSQSEYIDIYRQLQNKEK